MGNKRRLLFTNSPKQSIKCVQLTNTLRCSSSTNDNCTFHFQQGSREQEDDPLKMHLFHLIPFNFIYIAQNHNNGHLNGLRTGKLKIVYILNS